MMNSRYMKTLITHIASHLNETMCSSHPVSGGDISRAYLLETTTKKYFLKVNDRSVALKMFHAEQQGLQAIEATRTIAVPHVHLTDTFDGKAFLLMDFVESKRPDASDFQRLGTQLAQLHLCPQQSFGFPDDNFIGRLPQNNREHGNWPAFYWHQRIVPQLQLALDAHLLHHNEMPAVEKAIRLFTEIFGGEISPSLLHGDLWGGNYLIAMDGTPYLIDPAVYYGHSMVDIAMSRLFGGFGSDFYTAYHDLIPQPGNYEEQIDLYQLYYLLVHLNMFGSGYYSSVSSILKRYF